MKLSTLVNFKKCSFKLQPVNEVYLCHAAITWPVGSEQLLVMLTGLSLQNVKQLTQHLSDIMQQSWLLTSQFSGGATEADL